MAPGNLLVDSHGRVLRDLRVSVTDRCNFRCLYCLPETEAAANFYRGRWAHPNAPAIPIQRQWAPRADILSFEEIERVVRLAVDRGRRHPYEQRARALAAELVPLCARLEADGDLRVHGGHRRIARGMHRSLVISRA